MKSNYLRFTVIACLCAATGAYITADAKSYSLKVNLKDGTTIQHEVAGISHITFNDDNTASMVVSTATEAADPIKTSEIDRITFAGEQMIVATANGNTTHEIPTIDNIAFKISTTGIESTLDAADITVSVYAGVLTATAPEGTALKAEVYNTQGQLLGSVEGISSVVSDLNHLKAGVYVVKVNNKTIKFTR